MTHSYRKYLTAACVFVFFSNVVGFVVSLKMIPLEETPIILAVTMLAIPLASRASVARVGSSGLFLWCIIYFLITVLWYAFGAQTETEWQCVRTRCANLIFLVTMSLIFDDPGARNTARRVICIVAIISCLLNFYEVVNPGTFSLALGRSAGLYINANRAGAALILGLIFGLDSVPARLRPLYIVFLGLGIVATFSRSAAVCFVGVVLLMHLEDLRRLKSLAVSVTLGALVLLLAGFWWSIVSDTLTETGALNANTMRRRLTLSVEANDARFQLANLALERFYDAPMSGWGTGASLEPPFEVMGPHNQYLAFMVDHGILGALLLPAAVLLVLWRGKKWSECALPIAFFFLEQGFSSHMLFSNREVLTCLALAGMLPAKSRVTDSRTDNPPSPLV